MEENEKKLSRWQRFRAGSKDEYQLVVRDVKSYREVGSYNLTPFNLYVALAAILTLVAISVFLLIAYTPLRTYIPGYGDVVTIQEMRDMEDLLDEMGQRMGDQEVTIEALKRKIHEAPITADSIEDRTILVDTTNIKPVPLSEEEIRLRREMDLERVGQASRGVGGIPTPGSAEMPLAEMSFVVPVKGEISAGFKVTQDHLGVDILAPKDTPIKAARAGIVFMSEFTTSYGNVVGIQHDNNVITFYKHNSKLLKEVGDQVRAGEAIAIIGNTGTLSTGPHLHFELWHKGKVVDPTDFLSF
ncbi:MAG: M23 family metallopeptidase [Bacteroidota bacterium]